MILRDTPPSLFASGLARNDHPSTAHATDLENRLATAEEDFRSTALAWANAADERDRNRTEIEALVAALNIAMAEIRSSRVRSLVARDRSATKSVVGSSIANMGHARKATDANPLCRKLLGIQNGGAA